MNWKKVLRLAFISLLLLTISMAAWMQYGLIDMYGGFTERVNSQQFSPQEGPSVITNVQVLSPDGKEFLAGKNVTIADGEIMAIDTLPPREGFARVDGMGKYLIPGYTDAHVHLFKSPNDLLLYVANGVTQIRELIGEPAHLKWREQIRQGKRIGPDMYVASPRLGTFGRVEGWFMSWSQGFDNIPNPRVAEKAVKKYQRMGYDGIKIYSHLSPESYQALCATARAIDMPIMGHVPFSVGLEEIYNSGQSDIAHFEEIMNALNREFGYYRGETAQQFLTFVEERAAEVAQQLIKNGITVTSTMWGTEHLVEQKFELKSFLSKVKLEYENPGISEWSTMVPRGGLGWLPHVNRYQLPAGLTADERAGRRAHWEAYAAAEQLVAAAFIKSGVKIMTGTDANLPVRVPGFSLFDEFESLQAIGMSPAQVLRSSTSIPAEWMDNKAGRIEVGRKANLVLLDDNPLQDIQNTRNINAVVMNGQFFDRALLDEILGAVKMANNTSRKEDISTYVHHRLEAARVPHMH